MSISLAKSDYQIARAKFITTVKDEIKAALNEAFSYPDTQNVVFGVCTRPYNDEGCGQGTFGPILNYLNIDEDGVAEEFDYGNSYALFYENSPSIDNTTRRLRQVLSDAEWDFAGEALGIPYDLSEGYGRQAAFVAIRKPSGGYYFYQHDMDY